MKTAFWAGLLYLTIFNLSAQTIGANGQPINSTPPQDTPYAIVQKDANSRVWERTTYQQGPSGELVPHVYHYAELATGMHYKDPQTGVWLESKEQIETLPTGGAQAVHGQHQVYFPYDIYDGVIELVTPDGRHLKSRPLGIDYYDGSNSVFIATLKHSVGQILPSGNQVIYTNVFTEFAADLVCTYRKSGFESDLIFRERPPAPTAYGLNSENIRMELMTEFFDTSEPQQITPPTVSGSAPTVAGGRTTEPETSDTTLKFGSMTMVHGKAFEVGNSSQRISVSKSWAQIEGRTFLIEAVPALKITQQLRSLPMPLASIELALHGVSTGRLLPRSQVALGGGRASPAGNAVPRPEMQMAKASVSNKRGVVLDYNIINTTVGDYVFQGDSTYFISGFYGAANVTFEGGAVLKFDPEAGGLSLNGDIPIICNSVAYRPAILTSKDDDTVGAPISGSTGSPSTGSVYIYYDNLPASMSITLKNMRFCYASPALEIDGGDDISIDLWNCQFVSCAIGIERPRTDGPHLRNVLFDRCGTAVSLYPGSGYTLDAEQVTANVSTFVDASGVSPAALNLTNCLIFGSVDSGAGVTTNCVAINPSGPAFQTAGGGSYYLTNGSPFRNAGTANIDATLLSELRQKTTSPPIVYSNILVATNLTLSPLVPRDTDAPDLGYHYDPIDYLCGEMYVSNATLTVNAGTVIGCFGISSLNQYSLDFDSGANLLCQGTATNLIHIAEYATVQEKWPGGNWCKGATIGGGGYYTIVDYMGTSTDTNTIVCRFTDWSCLQWDAVHFLLGDTTVSMFRDCQFHEGAFEPTTCVLTNCLLERVDAQIVPPAPCAFCNNLLFGGAFNLAASDAATNSVIKDNNFDVFQAGRHLQLPQGPNIGFNAYVVLTNSYSNSYSGDIFVSNAIPYQAGPLGNFYLPTNSLINGGSVAANLVDLYHYTTQTNQIEEANSTVDIGYHYTALDQYGNILDSDDDSLGDWWETLYLGDLTHGGAEVDSTGSGNTLLYDYQNVIDPRAIDFFIQTTNDYVRTNFVALTLNVTSGTPFGIAIVALDTNFDGVTWSNCVSSNLTVNLSTTDGVYSVWVGLRGQTTNSDQIWHKVDFVLDRVPPQIDITNPAAGGIVPIPLAQVQGWGSEPLAGVTYDLTNADGLITNQTAFITGAYVDTNLTAFTTNYFQAYDVTLANGTNRFTFYATDLAGNTSTTNFTVILDTSGATNAPLVTVNWPDTNFSIAGTNFMLTGTVDDPTATVTVSGNGFTNLAAIVERDGRFTIPGVPLSASNNTFMVTVTNKAGLGTMASKGGISASSVIITVDPVQSSQISQDTMTLTGKVSDPSKDVWVNDVQAVVNEDGTWEADDVLVDDKNGSQQLNISAYPVGSDPGGTVPSGVLDPIVPLPPFVQSSGYIRRIYQWGNGSCGLTPLWLEQDYTWQRGKGGFYSVQSFATGGATNSSEDPWGTEDYLPAPLWANAFTGKRTTQTTIAFECGTSFVARDIDTRFVQTSVEVTAGPGVPDEAQLLLLTASANTYLGDPEEGAGDNMPVLGSQLRSPGIAWTSAATNEYVGQAFALIPAGGEFRTSLAVSGNPNVSFNIQADQYKLVHATRHRAPSNTNLDRTTIGVGEEVDFSGMPSNTIWSATAGSIFPTNGNAVTFTAPSNEISATVSAKVETLPSLNTTFIVKKPTGITNVVMLVRASYPNNIPGAGMANLLTVAPTTVCFYRVTIVELPAPVINITGIFTNASFNPTDIGSEVVSETNTFHDASATAANLPQPWYAGSYETDTPLTWMITGSTQTNSLFIPTAIFEMLDSGGTFRISKYGLTVTRSTNDVYF